MGIQEQRFITKNNVNMEEVMYLVKEGRKTVLHFADGHTLKTFHTIKGFLEDLPEGMFSIVNKGVAIAPLFLQNYKENTYTMIDGSEFKGRVRTSKTKKLQVEQYVNELSQYGWTEFTILDKFPMAFCVIELVFDKNGQGVDFIFRYCNQEMEVLEGKSMEEMIGKSFYEVFENGDKKWLITYADVALNGHDRIIESYSPEIDLNLRIYCSQPKPNYCACALVKI